MSEPKKVNPTVRRGKLAAPVPFVSPRYSGSLFQVLTGGEGKGNHRVPISPQQPRKEGSPGKENEERLP